MKLPGLRLRLATSQTIRQWAQRQLPNGKTIKGQILSPKTINYLTLKPEKDGLFCERLFGPIQESICACGRQPQHGQKFCPRCEVEYISPRVRRYRLGYIQLITAAAHVWFFKARPSYFSLFLNLPPKKIEGLLYCTQNISRTIFPKELENLNFYSSINSFKIPIFLRKCLLYSLENSKSFIFSSEKTREFYIFVKPLKEPKPKFFYLNSDPILNLLVLNSNSWSYPSKNFVFILLVHLKVWIKLHVPYIPIQPNSTQIQPIISDNSFLKKSLWQKGGLKDAALFFGFSLISKMLCWHLTSCWFSFVYFIINTPKRGDLLNKFYLGPPSLVNIGGFHSRLFCFTGVQLIRTWLTQLTQNNCNDGRLLEIQIRLDLLQLERNKTLTDNGFFEKIQLFRRFKYLRAFRHTQMNPASMVLKVLPVLPPDLRPILHLDNNQIAVSDFNKLYQTVLFRNRRLSRLTKDINFNCLNSEALQYAQRLLQEAVDSLIENDNTKLTTTSAMRSKPLKSLSDLFKGKKGRFRQNLLGKRVDYSGRSVIVVGPFLKIYECGLPKEIAYELFQPFLLRFLIFQKQAQTILGAKKLLKKNPKLVLNLLKEIVPYHPILLNRAPTLHRLSIQAFQPRLIEGRAILLHPLVCSAFNADFDGDQMGVHLPLCFEARAEAWKINWSQNSLFSVATGLPVCPPSQDIILGSSFLTTRNLQKFGFKLLKNYLINKFLKKRYLSTKKITTIRPILKTQYNKSFFDFKPHFLKNFDPTMYSFTTNATNGISTLLEVNQILLTQPYHPFNYYYKQRPNITKQHHQFASIQTQLQNNTDFIKEINFYNQLPIWFSYNPKINGFETEQKIQKLIEIRIHLNGNFNKFRSQIYQNYHSSGIELIRKTRTIYSRLKFYNNLLLF